MALLGNMTDDGNQPWYSQPGVRVTGAPEMSQDDPWAWLQWAQQREPNIYGWQDSPLYGQGSTTQGPRWWGADLPGYSDQGNPHELRTPEEMQALADAGYTWRQARGPGYQNLWQLRDGSGNVIDKGSYSRTQSMHGEDYAMYAAILAAAAGGTLYGGAGGAGGAATAGAGTGAGMTAAEQVAFMAANGMTDAQIAAAMGTAGSNAAGLTGVGAGSAAAGSLAPLAGTEGMGVTVPETYAGSATLAESGALSPELQAIAAGGSMAGGTVPAGYGTYTGATTGAGGLLSDAASWAAQNPKLVGAVVGGLAGSGGGGSSGGSGGGGSSGPAPTITRGQWSPSATPQYMQAPNFNWQAPTTGNANSGLWRFGGGHGMQTQTTMPQPQSLLPQPQSQSLLGPANQTQWQQPTGPTFSMSGQQLNQGSAMTQPNNPAQPMFSGVGYGSPAVDTTTPSPVSSGSGPASTAPAGFADMYRNHIGNASMSDEDAASRLATAARRYQMFGQSSDGLFGFTPESFKAYQSGNADAFRAALGSPAQKAPDAMYRYTGNAAGQAASDQALAAVQAQKLGMQSQPGGPMFSGVGGLLGGAASIQNKYNPNNKA